MFVLGYIVAWMCIGTIFNLCVLAMETAMDVYYPPSAFRWAAWMLVWPFMLLMSILGFIALATNSETLREMRRNVRRYR